MERIQLVQLAHEQKFVEIEDKFAEIKDNKRNKYRSTYPNYSKGKIILLFSVLVVLIAYFFGRINISDLFKKPPIDKPIDDQPNSASTTKFEIDSQNYPIIFPSPKTLPYAEQINLQDQLITACKQGDDKAVEFLLNYGAQPVLANRNGEHPLGAAVWGMNPAVVNVLLDKNGGVAPMTWEECKKHNLKYYQELFIIPKFDPKTVGEWAILLQKIDPNPFIRAFHVKKYNEAVLGVEHDRYRLGWD